MKLVNIKKYDIRGKLYYLQPSNLLKYNITSNDLLDINILNDDVFVAEEVISQLIKINSLLLLEWLELIVKDGYRSLELYELVYRKRCEIFWKDDTDKILNMDRKIHATGYAIDVSLAFIWGDELLTKFGSHGENAKYNQEQYDINFFQDSLQPEEQIMHTNRMKLYHLKIQHWFVLWTLNEYWHYELLV